MKNLETVEQLLEGIKQFSQTTARATHAFYFSNKQNKWVFNLTNNRQTFYADTPLEVLELAYVYIQLNRVKKEDATGYIL